MGNNKKSVEYVTRTLEWATTPKLPYSEVYKDYWWDADKDGNLIFAKLPKGKTFEGRSYREYFAPQANLSKNIIEQLGKKYCPIYDHAVQIPYVYLSHDCKDYE